MQYTLDRSSPVELSISIQAESIEVDAAFRKDPNDPRKTLADTLLSSILEKEHIDPISSPAYEGPELIPGNAYSFSVRFSVLPPIDIPEFSTLEIRVPRPDMEPEELRQLFLGLLRRYAELMPIAESRIPKTGEIVSIDISGLADGMLVPGMQAQNLRLRLEEGAGTRMPEVQALALTLQQGETGRTSLLCPQDHPNPAFRGREVELTVRLNQIFIEKLPTLDEAFAKKLGHASLTELEKKTLTEAMARKLDRIRRKAERELLTQLLDKTDFPIPPHTHSMFLQEALTEARDAMRRQGLDASQISRELTAIQDEAHKQAAQQAKAHCFLLALAFKEGLKVTEKDLDAAIADMARGRNKAALRKDLEERGIISDVQERLLTAKALEHLYKNTRKIVVDRNGDPISS